MSRRAVITGCGVVSALGSDARATWEALVAGRVGIGPITLFDTTRERTHTAAEIQGLPELSILSGRQRRRASRSDRMAFLASGQAIEDAGLDLERVDRRRAGLLLGGGSALLEGEAFLGAMLAAERRSPSRALGFFPATSADAVASHYGLSGEVDTLLTACSSATIAIGLAAMRVMSGAAEVMLAGGVETLSRATYSGFNSLRLVDPEPCRPFDRDRRGLSLGECAAILVIEDRDRARARGARVVAEIAGFGMAADAHHMTAPDPEGDGIARAMRAALRAAGITVEAVDHVNAHGTGTEQNDRAETRALRAVLGARASEVPVVSIKGMVGHCLGAAGAIEAFATAMALRHGLVPPTAGLRYPDPDCDLDHVIGAAREVPLRYALSNSLAFGGNNASLLLRRADG